MGNWNGFGQSEPEMSHVAIGHLLSIVRIVGAADDRIFTQRQLGYGSRARALENSLIRPKLARVSESLLPPPDVRLIEDLQIARTIVHRYFFLPFRARAVFPGQLFPDGIGNQFSVPK